MDTAALRIFVEVVRRGSFAAVARDRDLDPSSISRTIAGLEKQLGFGLFHRTTRRLAPTEAGSVYFDRIEPLVEELERARQMATDMQQEARGQLRVLAPVSFSLLNVVPHLPELARHHPELRFDLLLTDALLDLIDERIDVAIRLGPLADSRLVARRLAKMESRVVASPAYLQRHGRPKEPRDLADHECLLLDMPGFDARWRFRDASGRRTEVTVGGKLRTSNAIALEQCAREGMGIILQARWIIGRQLREGSLVDLFPEHEVTAATFDNSVFVLYPTRSYMPLKTRVFIDFLDRLFRDGPPWDRDRAPERAEADSARKA